MLRKILPFIVLSLAAPALASSPASGPEGLTLEAAVAQALAQNPQIQASLAEAQAESTMIRSQYAPMNPMFGIMKEKNMRLMPSPDEGGMPMLGTMNSWTISQELMFPTKYFAAGSAQKAKARAMEEEAQAKRLEIRSKTIAAYYKLHSLERSLGLLHANLDAARRTARVAEARRSTGQVPQQDEMKAHVEETRVNTEILLMEEDRQMAEAELAALLGTVGPIPLAKDEVPVPRLNIEPEQILELARANSRMVRVRQGQLEEAESRRTLAKMEYLPDFKLSYQKPFGADAPKDSYQLGVELTLPLWFGLRQSAEVSAASSMALKAEHQLTQAQLETASMTRSLAAKAKARQTLLRIYDTALIPQAQATFNSSEAAYRAGRVSLLELLDSQREVYMTRMAYYKTLAEFTQALSELEATVGTSISTLPMPPLPAK